MFHKKGTICIEKKQTKTAIQKGIAKLVVIANNCPFTKEISALAVENKVPIYNYTSTGVDLGYTCGKSFAVSAFAVLDEGGSNIVQLVQKRK